MVNQFIGGEADRRILETKCANLENVLDKETGLNRSLRRQLSAVQRAAQDSEWHLQEQLASSSNQLSVERSCNVELRSLLAERELQVLNLRVAAAAAAAATTETISNTHGDDNGSETKDISPKSTTSASMMTTPIWRERGDLMHSRASSTRSQTSGWGGGGGGGGSGNGAMNADNDSSSARSSNNRGQMEKLMMVAERLNITPQMHDDL